MSNGKNEITDRYFQRAGAWRATIQLCWLLRMFELRCLDNYDVGDGRIGGFINRLMISYPLRNSLDD